MKGIISLLVVLCLTACGLASSPTPTIAPTSTANPTETPTPARTITFPATPTPTLNPSGLSVYSAWTFQMMDAQNGWLKVEEDNTPFQAYFLHTNDGGRTWSDVTPNDGLTACGEGFFLDPTTAWLVRCRGLNSARRLIRTLDAGLTWTVVNADFTLPGGGEFSSLSFVSRDKGMVSSYEVGAGQGESTVFTTQDGGATWSQTIFHQQEEPTIRTCNICGDALDYEPFTAPSRILIAHGEAAGPAADAVMLSLSTDLGRTWKDISVPVPSSDLKAYVNNPRSILFFGPDDGLLAVDFTRLDTGGARSAFYATHDGGSTWQLTGVGADGSYISHEEFLSMQTIVGLCDIHLCITHDSGATWTWIDPPVNPADTFFGARFIDTNTGWALVYGHGFEHQFGALYQTTDGGLTWINLNAELLSK